MKTVSAIFFDLDGTLIDSKEDIADALNWALGRLSLPAIELEETAKLIGGGLKLLIQRAIKSSDPELTSSAIRMFREKYIENCDAKTTLMPGVLETLERYSEKKLAVVSNKPLRFCEKIVDSLKIGHFFQAVLGGDSVRAKKPAPEMIFHAGKLLHAPMSESLVVGDSHADVLAARAAGALCCGVRSDYGDQRALIHSEPDLLISSLTQLAEHYA